ncbi:MAG TPA: hypothetical protein PKE29_11110 [Phycisphaerales bacterium]|nr:hypothetical protein [Phycisphaerales bacterium]
MAEHPQAENSMFLKAFLPGVVLGVIVGMVVGMVVVPLFDRAPQIKPAPHGTNPVATERDTRPPAAPPAEPKPEATPEKVPAPSTQPGSPAAPAKP